MPFCWKFEEREGPKGHSTHLGRRASQVEVRELPADHFFYKDAPRADNDPKQFGVFATARHPPTTLQETP